ncbi:MAG: GTPase HflX [Roseivirga sp.]
MTQYSNIAPRQETAVLVALTTHSQSSTQTQEYVDELAFLATTLGINTLRTFTQKLVSPNVKSFVGAGKLAEIEAFVKAQDVDMVIFDDELSPSQVRNLEATLQCKILDRNLLILNIFAMRAQTSQAKTQVELAQYQYLLPRLTKMWTHLSRQKGGNTGMRGPGEKELETDRRIVKDKIAHLRKKLATIERQSTTQRRARKGLVRVALVGYTNVGKSTLMRTLAKTDVHTEDKLFATIASTVRRVVMQDIPFLLTDTVGFIRKLPHTLIECFKSTLDEVREADILLHVVDVSHPAHQEHIQIVQETLQEIGVVEVPTILVLNKADRLQQAEEIYEPSANTVHWQKAYSSQLGQPALLLSALFADNLAALKDVLFQHVLQQHRKIYPNYLKSAAC